MGDRSDSIDGPPRAEAHVRNLIEAGSSITGSAAGAAIGFFLGGPTGAATGGAAGAYFGHALRRIGTEVHDRYLAPREKARIGATLDLATRQIRMRLDRGEHLRDDGFFDRATSDRSDAEEVLEGVLTTAQRAYEERKLRYLSNLITTVSFDATFSKERANYVISLANRLTYAQYVLLSILGLNQIKKGSLSLKDTPWTDQISWLDPVVFLISQIMELERFAIVQVEGTYVLGVNHVMPNKIRVVGVGNWLWNGMKLGEIRQDDLAEFNRILFLLKN